MGIVRKLQSFFRLSGRQRRISVACLGWVGLIRLGLWVLPFRKMQRLGEYFGTRRRSLIGGLTPAEIVWAVKLSSRNVPRATCLVQALSAQILMGRNGHSAQVRIGVAVDAKTGFRAHAWLEYQGQVLIGGSDELVQYTPMLAMDHEFTVEELKRG